MAYKAQNTCYLALYRKGLPILENEIQETKTATEKTNLESQQLLTEPNLNEG